MYELVSQFLSLFKKLVGRARYGSVAKKHLVFDTCVGHKMSFIYQGTALRLHGTADLVLLYVNSSHLGGTCGQGSLGDTVDPVAYVDRRWAGGGNAKNVRDYPHSLTIACRPSLLIWVFSVFLQLL